MYADKLGYVQVDNDTRVVKSGPSGFFGLSVVSAGDVSVYDGLTASGTLLYTKTGAAAGTTVDFGGNGFAANSGLTVVTTGKVNVLYS